MSIFSGYSKLEAIGFKLQAISFKLKSLRLFSVILNEVKDLERVEKTSTM